MARWNLFNKSKTKQKEQLTEAIQEETTESENKPLAEHTETLHAQGSSSKKSPSFPKKNSNTSSQRIWRDVNAIEENIDNINKKKTTEASSEIDRTVDRLLEKRKRK